jgi:hypothetical protein
MDLEGYEINALPVANCIPNGIEHVDYALARILVTPAWPALGPIDKIPSLSESTRVPRGVVLLVQKPGGKKLGRFVNQVMQLFSSSFFELLHLQLVDSIFCFRC